MILNYCNFGRQIKWKKRKRDVKEIKKDVTSKENNKKTENSSKNKK